MSEKFTAHSTGLKSVSILDWRNEVSGPSKQKLICHKEWNGVDGLILVNLVRQDMKGSGSRANSGYLTPIVTILNELHDRFGTPFVQPISNTALSLISIVQIHTFVEAQQDGNRIKHFFQQAEMNTLLKGCHVGLQQASEVFKVDRGTTLVANMTSLKEKTENMHQELLELITSSSDGTTSDTSSSLISEKQIYHSSVGSQNSSNSLSMLPATQKIFHGCEAELQDIVDKLQDGPATITILGAGGIGKTSLAKVALHHPHIAARYDHRFFIDADSTTTSTELAALIGAHLGLKPGRDLTKLVVKFLSAGPPCLLVLDNLETPWEPLESRVGVEDFLSLLTDITHLALIITMRGSERPAKVRRTRPFLEPLKPLSDDAARKTFIEITDDCFDEKEIDEVLCLTGNMPLAVDLIAHLVDYEGCSNILTRWETEKTSLLSAGSDKRSSLDASIAMSLMSPRMTSGAKDLLSLLSILPDGLSAVELLQCNLPMQDILSCRATLLCTSLAYVDQKQRLKLLIYIANIGELSSLKGTMQESIKLRVIWGTYTSFQRTTGNFHTTLLDHLLVVLPQHTDHKVEARLLCEKFSLRSYYSLIDTKSLVKEGIDHFQHFNDPTLEAYFYHEVGYYYQHYKNDISSSALFFEKALSLAKSSGNSMQHSLVLDRLAWFKFDVGDYHAAQTYAREAQIIALLSGKIYPEAVALGTQALCGQVLGNLKEGIVLCQRARELLQLCGAQGSSADHRMVTILAELHLLKSEYPEARSIHVELAKQADAQQDLYYHALSQLNIAEIDIMIGAKVADVRENLENGKRTFRTLGLVTMVDQCETTFADLDLREGNILTAKDSFQRSLNAAWGKNHDAVLYCLERLADSGRWMFPNTDFSYQWPVIYLVQTHRTQEKLGLHKALCFIGDVFISEGDEDTAQSLFVVALEGSKYMDVHRSRADCMLRLGDNAKHRGDFRKAAKLWEEARPLFERSLQVNDVAQIDRRLAMAAQDMSDANHEALELLSKQEVPATLPTYSHELVTTESTTTKHY
ncbi:hypothetical protein C8R44DRAFT_738110 [Mycena epipterygia]|nr:hypothetical protein C8R44DRAFT_738110 [Mycena epipterygia]